LNRFARNSTTVSFAISEGWNVPSFGIEIQREAPFVLRPIPATWGSRHIMIVITIRRGSIFLMSFMGTKAKKDMAAKEIRNHMACLLTKYIGS
jgi:hypothetical protein